MPHELFFIPEVLISIAESVEVWDRREALHSPRHYKDLASLARVSRTFKEGEDTEAKEQRNHVWYGKVTGE